MKIKSPALLTYWVSSILFVLFFALEWQEATLTAKSFVIPAIVMFYLSGNHYKFRFWALITFLFSYIGDVCILLDPQHFSIYSTYCFFAVYLILVFFAFNDLKRIVFSKKDIVPIAIMLILLVYLLISVLQMQFENPKGRDFIFIPYGITLLVLATLAGIAYISKGGLMNLYFVLAIACFISSDVFFSIKSYYVYTDVFQILTISTQMLSYYFLAYYFHVREKAQVAIKLK